MAYINPNQQRRLADVDVATKVKTTMSTVFLAVTIITSAAVIIGALAAFANSILSAQ